MRYADHHSCNLLPDWHWICCQLVVYIVVVLLSQVAGAGTSDTSEQVDGVLSSFEHIKINLDEKYIDLEATVVTRESDWIELLACSPQSREYESILATAARPSHIHLALVMLGLEPGRPLSWLQNDSGYEIQPPEGDPVTVSLIVAEDGEQNEKPANEWIVSQQTGQVMGDAVWLFTGSVFATYTDGRLYKADLTGTVISLVNFGDDLLAMPNDLMNHNDNQAWRANTPLIPPAGSAIIIRIRPLTNDEPDQQSDKPHK